MKELFIIYREFPAARRHVRVLLGHLTLAILLMPFGILADVVAAVARGAQEGLANMVDRWRLKTDFHRECINEVLKR